MQDFLRQFKGREHGPLAQFIKYAIAGGIATTVHVSLFYFSAVKILPALNQGDALARLLHLHAAAVSDVVRARNSVIDNVIAFLFSNLTAYLINIKWVFESGRHHRVLEIGFFYLVSGISIVIGSSLMGFLIGRFGITTTMAFGANVLTSLLINFVLRKYLIFNG
ncbi:MAG TPA: GtrA family protein [Verrucomicrobiae bacterium]|nr:GtrA family protein [Verrucomicrobiae bacterium]